LLAVSGAVLFFPIASTDLDINLDTASFMEAMNAGPFIDQVAA
jgi:hypothetical protein